MSTTPLIPRGWTLDGVERYAQAWNEGVATDDLRARFGVRRPRAFSKRLRDLGWPLCLRGRGNGGRGSD
jgi:hypothetical protein